MAKLSAYGRRPVADARLERDTPTDQTIIWTRTIRRLMSDRTILVKRSVRFRPDDFHPAGRLHDGGWTRRGKLKPSATVDDFANLYRRAGWTVTITDPDGLPPLVAVSSFLSVLS
jgi:hypothetical protein